MTYMTPGEKFGKWTTKNKIRVKTKSGSVTTKWVVECECGEVSIASSADLRKGKTTKCRKCQGNFVKDLSGMTFGEWTVLKKGQKKNGKTHWICQCSCGNQENVCSASLIKKISTKCVECRYESQSIHGFTSKNRHPLYSLWITMISRCENPKNSEYHNYGARGIKVCSRWYDLELFTRDMGERPSLKHSIDRINNNGHYEPSNCRWATYTQQGRNKRGNRIIEYQNKKKCLTEWAEELKVKPDTLYKYLTRNSFLKAYKHFRGSRCQLT